MSGKEKQATLPMLVSFWPEAATEVKNRGKGSWRYWHSMPQAVYIQEAQQLLHSWRAFLTRLVALLRTSDRLEEFDKIY
jgi:hypothetical protein